MSEGTQSTENAHIRCGLCGEFCEPFCGAWANVEPLIPTCIPRGPQHTRTKTDTGSDYCFECSESAYDWVPWPCKGDTRTRPGERT